LNSEYKIGLHLISNNKRRTWERGYIHEMKKFHPNGEWHIIIEWEGIGKVQYTKTMLDECFSDGKINIDKQYYREQKINQLGI
jgi:hypothetical protein